MKFVQERLQRTREDRVSFFKLIQKPKVKTGLDKPKKAPRAVNIPKEEIHAISYCSKTTSACEAHSYPLTTVPLALSTEDKDLRQGPKSMLRNYMITEAASIGEEAPIIGVFTIGPLGPCPAPFELRKISHMAKTYNLREVAPVENH